MHTHKGSLKLQEKKSYLFGFVDALRAFKYVSTSFTIGNNWIRKTTTATTCTHEISSHWMQSSFCVYMSIITVAFMMAFAVLPNQI